MICDEAARVAVWGPRGDLWSDYVGIVMHNRFGPDWSRMADSARALQELPRRPE